jgi:hypothetical protein
MSTTKGSFGWAVALLVVGAACPAYGAEKLVQPAVAAVIHPNLDWKRTDGGAVGDDFVPIPSNVKKEREKSSLMLRKKDGSGRTATPRLLDPKIFFSSNVFGAELPAEIRQKGAYVRFLVQGTAKEDPELGTIFNIAGAILGYKARLNEGKTVGADLVAAVDFADGKRVWESVGVYMPVSLESKLTGNPPLCVKFDWAKNTWSMLVDDIVVREELPLYPEKGPDSVKIRAGSASGDIAMIKDISYSDHPSPRAGSPIRLNAAGKLDLEAALRAGLPGVHRGEDIAARPQL